MSERTNSIHQAPITSQPRPEKTKPSNSIQTAKAKNPVPSSSYWGHIKQNKGQVIRSGVLLLLLGVITTIIVLAATNKLGLIDKIIPPALKNANDLFCYVGTIAFFVESGFLTKDLINLHKTAKKAAKGKKTLSLKQLELQLKKINKKIKSFSPNPLKQ